MQTIGTGKDYDFEAITTVNGTTSVLIGVEGAKEKSAPYTNPSLKEYTITNTSSTNFLSDSGNSWSLGGMPLASNAGMEACTYVPYSACPQTWDVPTGHNGYFFAATQQAPGSIFIYDLPAANGGHQTVSTFKYRLDPPLVQAYKISDMFYSSNQNILYVLFDDQSTSNNTTTYFSVLQGLRANSEQFLSQGYMQAPYCGCEGVAEYSGDLYLGLDQNGSQKSQNGLNYNYVYKYADFSI
ncbi:MAG TPA: hypothetical protein VHI13_03750 [Candidatus Kapabacteria bacterium]|nr:hypothetical protein [Candidatus Kapabacteria bacterium]